MENIVCILYLLVLVIISQHIRYNGREPHMWIYNEALGVFWDVTLWLSPSFPDIPKDLGAFVFWACHIQDDVNHINTAVTVNWHL